MKELDKTSLKTPKLLQRSARIPMTKLAERIGLSTIPATERVRRLERDNLTTGYHAHLDPRASGQSFLIFVELKLHSKSGNIFEDFKHEVLKTSQISECHLVSGEHNYLIRVRLSDTSAYRGMLGNILLQLLTATESRSYVVMEEIKEKVVLDIWFYSTNRGRLKYYNIQTTFALDRQKKMHTSDRMCAKSTKER